MMALVRGVMAASSASGLIVSVLFLRPKKNRRGIIQQRLILVGDPEGHRDNDFVARFQQRLGHIVPTNVLPRMTRGSGTFTLESLFRLELVGNGAAQFINA